MANNKIIIIMSFLLVCLIAVSFFMKPPAPIVVNVPAQATSAPGEVHYISPQIVVHPATVKIIQEKSSNVPMTRANIAQRSANQVAEPATVPTTSQALEPNSVIVATQGEELLASRQTLLNNLH